MENASEQTQTSYNFGTFDGVFLPSILTMLGAIMFLRVNYVTGEGGILPTLCILALGLTIVLATALSISAISTNTPVKGGGVYFLISRTLGPGFGGSIGVTLFLAQGISIPFNILGFTEAVCTDYPVLAPYYCIFSILTGVVLLALTFSGADWAMKCQYVILGALVLGVLAMYSGALMEFSPETFASNLSASKGARLGLLFALFFPALTGIMTGVNMSGDLKNPSKSIPRGILLTILAGGILYALEIVICGGAFSRDALINEPYKILVSNAPFNAGFLLTIGVAAATLSTALGLYVCAPRVLQAMANDNIMPFLSILGRGRGRHNDPVWAIGLLGVMALGIILAASVKGLSTDGMSSGMNTVAQIATMFFLLTYAMVNLAAFVESYGESIVPSPFRFFHWSIALYGFLACLAVSFYIDFMAAGIALAAMWILFVLIKRRRYAVDFGDARRGFLYSRIRGNLLALSRIPPDPKNWRPTITILSDYPYEQEYMPYFASLLESDRGIVSLVNFVEAGDDLNRRDGSRKELQRMLWDKNGYYSVFPEVVFCHEYDYALRVFLQSHLIGPLKPNIVMMNYAESPERVRSNLGHIRAISKLGMSSLLMTNFSGFTPPVRAVRGTIDLWWRGMQNFSMMLILANLLHSNPMWHGAPLRILRAAGLDEDTAELNAELKSILESARIEAETVMIRSEKPFKTVLREISSDSAVLFLGFIMFDDDEDNVKDFSVFRNILKECRPLFL